MAKKHAWVSNTAMRRLTGIRATCLDCRESRTGSLRGGICPGVRMDPAAEAKSGEEKS